MAILLRQLCEKASYLYGMRILAGENGTGNIVQWIHTLEAWRPVDSFTAEN